MKTAFKYIGYLVLSYILAFIGNTIAFRHCNGFSGDDSAETFTPDYYPLSQGGAAPPCVGGWPVSEDISRYYAIIDLLVWFVIVLCAVHAIKFIKKRVKENNAPRI